ncbi:MAG TPA: thiamine phosphate synthase, partial [Thermomicrobiaceae bacterium]|nr:thiamine phosphate synthase [Thermomicrobiaceae bacterium]
MSGGTTTLPVPRLHLISDRRLCPLDRFAAIAGLAVEAGFDAVQLREKNLGAGLMVEAGRQLRKAVGNRASLFINERLDVALVLSAH